MDVSPMMVIDGGCLVMRMRECGLVAVTEGGISLGGDRKVGHGLGLRGGEACFGRWGLAVNGALSRS